MGKAIYTSNDQVRTYLPIYTPTAMNGWVNEGSHLDDARVHTLYALRTR